MLPPGACVVCYFWYILSNCRFFPNMMSITYRMYTWSREDWVFVVVKINE